MIGVLVLMAVEFKLHSPWYKAKPLTLERRAYSKTHWHYDCRFNCYNGSHDTPNRLHSIFDSTKFESCESCRLQHFSFSTRIDSSYHLPLDMHSSLKKVIRILSTDDQKTVWVLHSPALQGEYYLLNLIASRVSWDAHQHTDHVSIPPIAGFCCEGVDGWHRSLKVLCLLGIWSSHPCRPVLYFKERR